MSDEENKSGVWGFIKGFGKLIIGALLVLQGLVGLAMLVLFISFFVAISSGFNGGKAVLSVPKDAALLLNPNGVLVEEAEMKDPIELALAEAYGASEPQQIEVGEMARVIREAATDDRIKGIVLDLSRLYIAPISASKAHYLAAAIEAFKTSGKKVYSVGDFYSQMLTASS